MKSNIRIWILNLFLILTSLVLCVILTEIILRIFFPKNLNPHSPGLYSIDESIGYTISPNHKGRFKSFEFDFEIRTNSIGLRDGPIDSKNPDDFRILILGDSFTFGEGVEGEEAYPGLVEEYLDKKLDRNIQVFNAGVSGYGTKQQLNWFEKIVDHVQPDAVILGFFVGNDFTDNIQNNKYRIISGFLVQQAPDGDRLALTQMLGIPPEIKIFLRTNFQLYQLLNKAWVLFLVKTGMDTSKDRFDMYRNTLSVKGTKALKVTKEAIRRLLTACQLRNLPLGIVVIPDIRYHKYIKGISDYSVNTPSELAVNLSKDEKLPVLDLGPYFSGRIDVIFPIDGHWKPNGHQLAAGAIGNSLLDGELKPLLTELPIHQE